MMVLSGEMPDKPEAVEGQHEMFRRVRAHAKQANDRRPVKSPAEGLLTLLEPSARKWRKVFNAEPGPVAAQIIRAVEQVAQPCLMLVSKGMHWVVAFGRTLRDDGTVAGVLLRDPAWAGMPKFFGLTTVPDKPTFDHTAHAPCKCLESDNPPGSVHERYFSMDELLSPRGLQGSPDWEGKGALALVPAESGAAAAIVPAPPSTAPLAGLTPQQAAMEEARVHGLCGRPDSPPDWQAVLEGGQAGAPILVKDPNDPRDNFYLVPVHSGNPALRRTAWIMLDTVTLRMREASLLDNWMVPAFPTDQDADNISDSDVTLPDGKRHRFNKNELRPNQRNLVWQASAASILPYWPLREFTAPHPETGEQVSIYATQHGEIYTALGPDDVPATQQSQPEEPQHQPRSPKAPSGPSGGLPWKSWLVVGAAAAGITLAVMHPWTSKEPVLPAVEPGSRLQPLHAEALKVASQVRGLMLHPKIDIKVALGALQKESYPPVTDPSGQIDVSLWLVTGFKPDGVRFDGIETDPVRHLDTLLFRLGGGDSQGRWVLDKISAETLNSARIIRADLRQVQEKWKGLEKEIAATRRSPRAFLEAMLDGFKKMTELPEPTLSLLSVKEAHGECRRFAAAYALTFGRMLETEDAVRLRMLILKADQLEITAQKQMETNNSTLTRVDELLKGHQQLESGYSLTLADIQRHLPMNRADFLLKTEIDVLLPEMETELGQLRNRHSILAAELSSQYSEAGKLKADLESRLEKVSKALGPPAATSPASTPIAPAPPTTPAAPATPPVSESEIPKPRTR